ncbi:MAG: hypothetical protein WBZ29_14955 [Methanocella sp.]
MRVCISVNDSAQVHFWKNVIKGLQSDGHQVFVCARDFGESSALLREMNIPFFPAIGDPGYGVRRYLSMPIQVASMYRHLRDKGIDVIAGFGIFNTFAGLLLRRPDITFIDAEPGVYTPLYKYSFLLSILFVDALVTPSCLKEQLGRKHIRVDSYKELAYLHPNHFQPNEDIYDLLGIPRGTDYAILRFNSFEAGHDIGVWGFSPEERIRLVRELEKHARVFISTEGKIPDEIKANIIDIPRYRIHDALYYAKLMVTDSSTMGIEAAVLGTPVVRASSFVKNDFGLMLELGKTYDILLSYLDTGEAIDKAVELIRRPDVKQEWAAKRERLLKDKIDMAAYMVWFIENYPRIDREAKKNPEIFDTLKRQPAGHPVKGA